MSDPVIDINEYQRLRGIAERAEDAWLNHGQHHAVLNRTNRKGARHERPTAVVERALGDVPRS
ncbi:hypothetical protein K4B79_11365 [Streptomyces lincolnensis]|uniref:hypothetical protein n=1 Tax=Streptomyces lincolnensis TaxID=1915 RepID=UPI001E5DFB3D|nr:hypothetical protein [Streptomyces lincolnensis]MCD7438819.1 hypothetical protein [Streptomyces lincolnensis]